MIGLLGDSLSVGTYPPLSRALGGDVALFARVGAPVAWMDAQVDSMAGVSTVLLMGGTNDLPGASPEVVAARVKALAERLSRAGHPVVVGTLPTQQGAGKGAVSDFNALLLSWTPPPAITVADVGSAVAESDLGPDGIHPGPTGYSKLARAWQAALSPAPAQVAVPSGGGLILLGAVAAAILLARRV